MWANIDEAKIKWYVDPEFHYRPNLAIFSFKNTLIQGLRNVVPFTNSVISRLNEIDQKGSIVVIENRFTQHKEIEENVAEFMKYGPPNILYIFILSQNRYKKPNTNILEILSDIYGGRAEFDFSKSIVVGGAAGRLSTRTSLADADDCDRAFAHNLGVTTFRTPEQFFLEATESRIWRWCGPHISGVEQGAEEPSFDEILDSATGDPSQKTVIFVTGGLSSGKSVLLLRLVEYCKKKEIPCIWRDRSRHDIGQICEGLAKFHEDEAQVCIVADVLYDEVFDIYLSEVSPNMKCRIVEMTSSLNACIFLDRFCLQITKSMVRTPYKRIDIAKWFLCKRRSRPFISIKFPLVLRTRKESFFRY